MCQLGPGCSVLYPLSANVPGKIQQECLSVCAPDTQAKDLEFQGYYLLAHVKEDWTLIFFQKVLILPYLIGHNLNLWCGIYIMKSKLYLLSHNIMISYKYWYCNLIPYKNNDGLSSEFKVPKML